MIFPKLLSSWVMFTRGHANPKIMGRYCCSPLMTIVSKVCADVHLIPMFQDNYGFLLTDRETKITACIDAGDGDAIIEAVKFNNYNLAALFVTHKHHDHIGGNHVIKRHLPSMDIIGTKYEHIPCLTKAVGDGDSFAFGSLKVTVIHTPCHTKGHVAYFVEAPDTSNSSSPLLFCGDTLFVGGCGRFFEGTAAEMLANMDKFSLLPPDTLVFCAHEYTESNLRFLVSVDPEGCSAQYAEVRRRRAAGEPTVPTTIGKELEYNLFMKCRELRTQKLVGAQSAEEAMSTLRKMKNDFQ